MNMYTCFGHALVCSLEQFRFWVAFPGSAGAHSYMEVYPFGKESR